MTPAVADKRFLGPRKPPEEFAALKDLRLDDGRYIVDVLSGTVDGEFEEDLDTSSVLRLTVRDFDRALLTSDMMARFRNQKNDVDLEINGIWYRLTQVKKTGHTLTLLFEDRAIAQLRRFRRARVFRRGAYTRAQAVRALLREPKKPPIRFVIPEINVNQTVEKPERGLKTGLKIKGKPADSAQLTNLEKVLNVGTEMGAKRRVLVASIMAAIQESTARNLTEAQSHLDSAGLFQIRRMHIPKGEPDRRRVPEWSARWWFTRGIQYYRESPGIALGALAQAVERSAHPENYDVWKKEAVAIVDAYLGGDGVSSTQRTRGGKKYLFKRKNGTDTWETLREWAAEVNWRRFANANVVYYVSDAVLVNSPTRFVFSEDDEGVDAIDFDVDYGKRVEKATIVCRGDKALAPIGSAVQLVDCGPADGKWIVSNRRRGLFSSDIRLTLAREMRKKPEPIATIDAGEETGEKKADRKGVRPLGEIHLTSKWGGTQDIFTQYVIPFMVARGLPVGSQKRTYDTVDGSDMSDHFVGSTQAYAVDFPTPSGEAAARALARDMGNATWKPNSYDRFTITVDGGTFSVQIIWGAEAKHGDHVHVGIARSV